MKQRSIFIGEIYTSNSSGRFEVIDYLSSNKILIKFINNGYERWVRSGAVMSGKIQNKYTPTDMGVGFLGEGKYKFRDYNGGYTAEYLKWHDMLYRCYSPRAKKCYRNVLVCKDWHNFQNFAKWMTNQVFHKGWHLDKDLLASKNKEYSPSTCLFLPTEINSFLSSTKNKHNKLPLGVTRQGKKFSSKILLRKKQVYIGTFETANEAFLAYKSKKEEQLFDLANQWKGIIDDKAYAALINYEIKQYD